MSRIEVFKSCVIKEPLLFALGDNVMITYPLGDGVIASHEYLKNPTWTGLVLIDTPIIYYPDLDAIVERVEDEIKYLSFFSSSPKQKFVVLNDNLYFDLDWVIEKGLTKKEEEIVEDIIDGSTYFTAIDKVYLFLYKEGVITLTQIKISSNPKIYEPDTNAMEYDVVSETSFPSWKKFLRKPVYKNKSFYELYCKGQIDFSIGEFNSYA